MGLFVRSLVSFGLASITACGAVKDPDQQVDARPEADAMIDAPPVLAIGISPEMPRTKDDLVVSIVSGTGPTTPTWRWSLNDTERTDLTTETIANDQTTKGDVWKVELLDGTEVKATTEVTIQNSPPSAPTVTYNPAAPTASLGMRCIVSTPSTDDDGDAVTYSGTWTQNGNAFASTSTTTFPADTVGGAFTKVNDVFHCTVAASDGIDSTVGDPGAAAAAACRVYGSTATLNATSVGASGTIQTFTVPAGVCSVRIEVAGAKGGNTTTTAGKAMNNNGARMIGTFAVTEASALKVIVGHMPTGSGPYAGGGGTFVTTMTNTPMIIAGGGGSNFCNGNLCTISDIELMGRIVTSGGTTGSVPRADNGQGGNILAGAFTGAGAGLLTNGQGTTAALSFVNGGTGGGSADVGGFGGGGGRNGSYGEGGGGGYSGGSCANDPVAGTWLGCGGGGSYNNGTSISNSAGVNAGAGYAKFTY